MSYNVYFLGHLGMWKDLLIIWWKMPKLGNVFVPIIWLRVRHVCDVYIGVFAILTYLTFWYCGK